MQTFPVIKLENSKKITSVTDAKDLKNEWISRQIMLIKTQI